MLYILKNGEESAASSHPRRAACVLFLLLLPSRIEISLFLCVWIGRLVQGCLCSGSWRRSARRRVHLAKDEEVDVGAPKDGRGKRQVRQEALHVGRSKKVCPVVWLGHKVSSRFRPCLSPISAFASCASHVSRLSRAFAARLPATCIAGSSADLFFDAVEVAQMSLCCTSLSNFRVPRGLETVGSGDGVLTLMLFVAGVSLPG